MSERFVPSRLALIAAAALLVSAPLSARADNDHHGGGRSHGKHYGKHYDKHYGKHGGNHYGYYAPPVYYGPPPCAHPRVYNYYPAAVPVPFPVPVPIPVTRGPNVVVHVGADWVLGF